MIRLAKLIPSYLEVLLGQGVTIPEPSGSTIQFGAFGFYDMTRGAPPELKPAPPRQGSTPAVPKTGAESSTLVPV